MEEKGGRWAVGGRLIGEGGRRYIVAGEVDRNGSTGFGWMGRKGGSLFRVGCVIRDLRKLLQYKRKLARQKKTHTRPPVPFRPGWSPSGQSKCLNCNSQLAGRQQQSLWSLWSLLVELSAGNHVIRNFCAFSVIRGTMYDVSV